MPPQRVSIAGHEVVLECFDESRRVGCEDGTGFEVWHPATAAACWALMEDPSLVRGQHVLELGCGLGVLGILCAKLGAASVLFTDREGAVIRLAERNALLNGVASRSDFMVLDFTRTLPPCRAATFDLVVASDVLFRDKMARPLSDFLNGLACASSPKQLKAVLGHEVRRAVYRGSEGEPRQEETDSSLELFLKACGTQATVLHPQPSQIPGSEEQGEGQAAAPAVAIRWRGSDAPAAEAAEDGTESREDVASPEIRSVQLPSGWEGLSIKLCGERVVVSEVPKSCFSSRAFGAQVARPQVEGVTEGDEVVTVNGDPPARLAERIVTAGDPLCACTSGEEKHAVGSKTKFDSPPCAACDFGRRRPQLGFDVALQMWLRAVKRDIKIVLGVRAGNPDWAKEAERTLASTTPSASSIASRASTVVELKASAESVSKMEKALAKLAALDDATRKKAKESKGKGKGKDKGHNKGGKAPSGPDLPRTRLTNELVTGQVDEWRGKYGWIKPTKPVDHPQARKHKGRLYVHMQDLEWWVGVKTLKVGQYCRFHVYVDTNSLGAEECTVLGEEGSVDWDSGWGGWTEASSRERSRSR